MDGGAFNDDVRRPEAFLDIVLVDEDVPTADAVGGRTFFEEIPG